MVNLGSYCATLKRTKGVMEEFVNPKYADATKTTFKKPTRLECMMQDYAKVARATHSSYLISFLSNHVVVVLQ